MENKRLDHKFAAYTFMLIVGCMLALAVVLKSVATDFNNFWESSVAQIVLYGLFVGLFFVMCGQLKLKGREIPKAIDLDKKVSWWNLGVVVLVSGLTITCFMLAMQGFSDIMIWLGYKQNGGTGPDGVGQYIMAVFTLCLLPAVVEELFFRGLILKGLMPMGKGVAVVASAFLFSLFHFSLEQTVYQFALGIIFALVVLKTGNLLYGMILHFLNNFFVLMTYIFWGDVLELLTWDALTIVMAVGLVVLGALMIVGAIKALRTHGTETASPKTAKFWAVDNIGFYIASALGLCLWITMLFSGGG